MSLRTPDLAVEIAVSNMDLYPVEVLGRASLRSGLEQLAAYLEATGCCNLEIWPTNIIVEDVVARSEQGDTELVERVVGSLHQSAFDGHGFVGRVMAWCGVQTVRSSLNGMRAIQAALPGPVPAVGYLEESATMDWQHECPGSYRLFQPIAAENETGPESYTQKLLHTASALGFLGLCPDTVHARTTRNGFSPPAWEAVWADQFASGRVFQVHFGLDRTDVGWRGDQELAATSHQEFEAFSSSCWRRARNTENGEMITVAIESWAVPDELAHIAGQPVLRMVIEAMPTVRPVAFLKRMAQHARIVENLAEIVREAGATPLLWGAA